MMLGWVSAGLLLLGGLVAALIEHAWAAEKRANRERP